MEDILKPETPFEVRESQMTFGQPALVEAPVLKTTLQKPSEEVPLDGGGSGDVDGLRDEVPVGLEGLVPLAET